MLIWQLSTTLYKTTIVCALVFRYHIPARRSQRIAKIMTSTDSTSEQKTLNSTYNLSTNDNLLINNEVKDDLDQSSSSLDVLNTGILKLSS